MDEPNFMCVCVCVGRYNVIYMRYIINHKNVYIFLLFGIFLRVFYAKLIFETLFQQENIFSQIHAFQKN